MTNKKDLDDILFKLEDYASDFDLEGVEFTFEDAELVRNLMKSGVSETDAISEVLRGIKEVLN